ncbi:MAG: alpha/beta hydrolase [Actinomycetota bacterium]|nr:alpha/beta hydrolase [Actinomycetota bacterium]
MKGKKVTIESEGLKLRGKIWKHEKKESILVVLCHGIPLSKSEPGDPGYDALADSLYEGGYSALFVNMRGTGDSQGSFDPDGWYKDLIEIMNFASLFDRRVMAGFSFGGLLSLRYAASNKGGLLGVASFASPARLGDVFRPEVLSGFIESAKIAGIIRDDYASLDSTGLQRKIDSHDATSFVSKISPVPLLFVHGEKDEVVPVEQGYELFEMAGAPKELKILQGGGHRLRRDGRVLEILFQWLKALEQPNWQKT